MSSRGETSLLAAASQGDPIKRHHGIDATPPTRAVTSGQTFPTGGDGH